MRTGIFLLTMIACSLVLGSIVSINIYHSLFFNLLLVGLCVNTTLCCVERLWRKRRPVANLPNPQNCTFFYHEYVRGKDPVIACSAIERMLKEEGFKTALREKAGRYDLYGERGLSGTWGMFGAHISVVFIAAGVLYGAYAGYDTTVTLTEGTGHTITRAPGQTFVLWLDRFSTTYYEDGTVSDWVSDVAVEQNGQVMVRREIKVNHPLSFRGVKVYLASQGTLLQARVLDSNNRILSSTEIAAGDKVDLPGPEGGSIRVLRYIPDYDPLRPLVSKTPQPRNPYVLYALSREGEPEKRRAVPLNEPQSVDGGATFVVFPQVLPIAGLHVKYDPGLPFVWVGFGLLGVGFYLIYYTPYRRLWVQMIPAEDGLEISCAGRGSNVALLQDKVRSILAAKNDL